MKIPKQIQPLVDDGLVDEVISRLMSGKEADVYVVRCGEEIRCAKVYKDAVKRSFKKPFNTRKDEKYVIVAGAGRWKKGSKFGRQQQEETWQNAEVDALYLLASAGVRVPQPYDCMNGVLLMELITDEEGDVAPRLNDVTMSAEQAIEDHMMVMHSVKKMLCAGLVHGDLSEFNVLVDAHGPVIIDLPQAVNAVANNNAQAMLTRDVQNMTRYYAQFAPALRNTHFEKEIWSLFENGELLPDTELTGQFEEDTQAADVDGVMLEIKAILAEEQERQLWLRDDGD